MLLSRYFAYVNAGRVAKHYENYDFLSADNEFELLMSRDVTRKLPVVNVVSITSKYLRTCMLYEIVSVSTLFVFKHSDREMTSS